MSGYQQPRPRIYMSYLPADWAQTEPVRQGIQERFGPDNVRESAEAFQKTNARANIYDSRYAAKRIGCNSFKVSKAVRKACI